MANVSRSDRHPGDGELAERILAREGADDHVRSCPACRARFDDLAKLLDPAAGDGVLEGADPFWKRQSARIGARIAAGERSAERTWLRLFGGWRLVALAGASAAALFVAAVGLRTPGGLPAPVEPAATTVAVAPSSAANGSGWSSDDAKGDALLREVDQLIDEDPYESERYLEG